LSFQNSSHQINAESDKLRLLYHQSFPAVFFSLVAAFLYAAIFWPLPDNHFVVFWLSALIAASALRIALFLAYRHKKPDNTDIYRWKYPYFLSLQLSSLTWGLGTVIVSYNHANEYQFITCFFLVGMAGSALSVYSAIRFFAIITCSTLLLPLIIWFLFQQSLVHAIIAISCILFLLSASRATLILSQTLHRSFMLTHELTEAKETAEHLSKTDVLTGLNNRRAFTEFSKQQLQFCQRENHDVSLLMLDLDLFKNINDSYGHAAGDTALQHMAKLMRDTVRSSDICGRTGGEEFAILLPNTDLNAATDLAEKLCQTVEHRPVNTPERSFNISISIGISNGHYGLETLLQMADKAMYHAKQGGRNQVKPYISSQLSLDID